jgi:hypothetical protein
MSDTIPRARMTGVPRQAIAARAFEIYQRRMSENRHASSHDDWLQAEHELWQELFASLRRASAAA